MSRRLAVLAAAFLVPLVARGTNLAWRTIDTADGITVSKAVVEGSPFVAFKGETVMDAPMERVLFVLLDNDHRIEWVDRLYKNQLLESVSPYDYVLYQAFELPVFSDRDYVYHGLATRDPGTGVVTLEMRSVDHPKAPPTVGVRAKLVDSRYVLTPVGPAQTRVEVEICTDPMGSMPAWIVNLIQRSWPRDTLNGIEAQLEKAYAGSIPLP